MIYLQLLNLESYLKGINAKFSAVKVFVSAREAQAAKERCNNWFVPIGIESDQNFPPP